MLGSLWNYRYFIFTSIRNDIRTRFINSKLGALWMIFNPLAQALIYALILSNVLAAKLPGIENKYAFSVYLLSGLLGWTLFSETITRSCNLFIENANLLKKINFPRATLAAIVLGSCLLNNLILFYAILLILIALGYPLILTYLLILPLMLIVALLAFGIGMILGVINVFVRDISQVLPIVLQTLFWFTPIAYPIGIIPDKYMSLLKGNPLYPLIDAYHQILLYGQTPDISSLLPIIVACFITLILGTFMFRKASPEMVDVL
jgi:lipopolysaccharide transport system permease protein